MWWEFIQSHHLSVCPSFCSNSFNKHVLKCTAVATNDNFTVVVAFHLLFKVKVESKCNIVLYWIYDDTPGSVNWIEVIHWKFFMLTYISVFLLDIVVYFVVENVRFVLSAVWRIYRSKFWLIFCLEAVIHRANFSCYLARDEDMDFNRAS